MNQKENDNINKTNLRVDEGECFISRTFEEVSQRKQENIPKKQLPQLRTNINFVVFNKQDLPSEQEYLTQIVHDSRS